MISGQSKKSPATTRAHLYLMASYMGAAGTIMLIAGNALDWPDFLVGFSIGIMLVSLILLLRRKLRDEYYQRLWNAGTSWAFVALVISFLFAPFLGGVLDGMTSGDAFRDMPGVGMGSLAILAFFAGFHFERLRG